MKDSKYDQIIDEIQKTRGYGVHDNVEKVAEAVGIPYETIRAIRSQYLQRKSIRNYYKVKDKTNNHLRNWKKGITISDLALKLDFPPALLANFLLMHMGYTKKRTKEILKDPTRIEKPRLRKELKEVMERDELYTPISHNKQAAEGGRREDTLAKWLDKENKEYFTENELKDGTVEGKTPDFLLVEPLVWHGDKYNWVESKASFGEHYVHRKNHKGQIAQYVELYGEGLLVYWYGYLDSLKRKRYEIVDRKELGLE